MADQSNQSAGYDRQGTSSLPPITRETITDAQLSHLNWVQETYPAGVDKFFSPFKQLRENTGQVCVSMGQKKILQITSGSAVGQQNR